MHAMVIRAHLDSSFSSLLSSCPTPSAFFFFNDTATTEIYTLSLHDALPISNAHLAVALGIPGEPEARRPIVLIREVRARSEEHTSELQSPDHLVCRLLLEKKKTNRSWTRVIFDLTSPCICLDCSVARMAQPA